MEKMSEEQRQRYYQIGQECLNVCLEKYKGKPVEDLINLSKEEKDTLFMDWYNSFVARTTPYDFDIKVDNDM